MRDKKYVRSIMLIAGIVWLGYIGFDIATRKKYETPPTPIEDTKYKIDSLKNAIDSLNAEYEYLLEKFNDSTDVQVIKEGYEIEVNRIRNLPIDSTVSNLSEWLSKGTTGK